MSAEILFYILRIIAAGYCSCYSSILIIHSIIAVGVFRELGDGVPSSPSMRSKVTSKLWLHAFLYLHRWKGQEVASLYGEGPLSVGESTLT